jgi:hypothetical protein
LSKKSFNLAVVSSEDGGKSKVVFTQNNPPVSFNADFIEGPAQLFEEKTRRNLLRF